MDDNDIFHDLNEQQIAAVKCSIGNKLILAGAGSGKTRVLTCRVAELINKYKVRPSNILALTFTNKAAKEMKERISKITSETQGKSIWMGTFHSIFARILRSESELIASGAFKVINDYKSLDKILKVI